jgi:hypothetical protein
MGSRHVDRGFRIRMATALAILLSLLAFTQCKQQQDPPDRPQAPLAGASVLGFWISKNGHWMIYLEPDGTYVSITKDVDGNLGGAVGKWAVSDLRLYSYWLSDLAGILPDSKVTVFRKEKPDQPGTEELDGQVYEFLAEGHPPGSSENSKFYFNAEEQVLDIDGGDISSWMRRLPEQ